MEDASHGGLDGSVVEIDRFWVVRSAPRAAWRGPYCDGLCLVRAQTRAATWEAVKPFGEAEKAISASSTARMRALLRSMPPTMVLPTCEAVGSCSSSSSAMKH